MKTEGEPKGIAGNGTGRIMNDFYDIYSLTKDFPKGHGDDSSCLFEKKGYKGRIDRSSNHLINGPKIENVEKNRRNSLVHQINSKSEELATEIIQKVHDSLKIYLPDGS